MSSYLSLSWHGPIHNRRPSATSNFKGRRSILEQLDAFFNPRVRGTYCRREFLLHGVWGSGKSEIALQFAQLCGQRFKYVWWLNARDTYTIDQSYRDIAAAIGATDIMSQEATRMALASLDGDWLLIIDNANDVHTMSQLRPPGFAGSILWTSRNPCLQDLLSDAVCEVSKLEEDEAVQLLLDVARIRSMSDVDTALAKGIVNRLGNLPGAIALVSMYFVLGHLRIYDLHVALERLLPSYRALEHQATGFIIAKVPLPQSKKLLKLVVPSNAQDRYVPLMNEPPRLSFSDSGLDSIVDWSNGAIDDGSLSPRYTRLLQSLVSNCDQVKRLPGDHPKRSIYCDLVQNTVLMVQSRWDEVHAPGGLCSKLVAASEAGIAYQKAVRFGDYCGVMLGELRRSTGDADRKNRPWVKNQNLEWAHVAREIEREETSCREAEDMGMDSPPMPYTDHLRKDATFLNISYDELLSAARFYGERNNLCHIALKELAGPGQAQQRQAALAKDLKDLEAMYDFDNGKAQGVRSAIGFFERFCSGAWVRPKKITNQLAIEDSTKAEGCDEESKKGKKGKKDKKGKKGDN